MDRCETRGRSVFRAGDAGLIPMWWLFLSLIATSVSAKEVPLCRWIVARVGENLSGVFQYAGPFSPAQIKGHYITNLIIGAKPLPPPGRENPYTRHVITVRDNRSLHLHRERSPQEWLDGVAGDSAMVLTLPKPGERTIWEQLDPEEKLALVSVVVGRLNHGLYDRAMKSNRYKESGGVYHALKIGRIQYTNMKWYELEEAVGGDAHEIDIRVGLSPRRLLVAANRGELSGTCRQGNTAAVGILGELGIRPDEVRFVLTGFYDTEGKRRSGHLHFEIRHPLDPNTWVPFDATSHVTSHTEEETEILQLTRSVDKYYYDFLIPVEP